MMESNALRKLEVVLDEAVSNGDRNKTAGPILLRAMKLAEKPQKIIYFYDLLSKAKEEVEKLRNQLKKDKYVQMMEELNSLFIVNHLWATQWSTFASYIDERHIIITLDLLAQSFHSQSPQIPLEQDFLEKLHTNFKSLLDEILTSDLSNELKTVLVEKLEDILQAIRRYYIDGTNGLKKAAQSLAGNLVMIESHLQDKDKKNPLYIRTKAWLFTLLISMTHPSFYDITGTAADIYGMWGTQIEQIIRETPNIQDAFEKFSSMLSKQPQRSISGVKEPKALPASKEDPKANPDNRSTS